jgi:drug/metabolite transporter (DMT)-like permease
VAEKRSAPTGQLVLAFAAVYVIWGSTYLAIQFAIKTLPPLLMAGVRFLLAGAVLYLFMRVRGQRAPTARQWRTTAVIGALLVTAGNGGVVLAETSVPSGVVALMVAMVPLWMVLLEWLRPGGVRPTARTAAGLVVGFAGIVLLVGPGDLAGGGGVNPAGALLVLCGSLCWAAGSIYARSAALPENGFMATAMEMTCGGALLLAIGLARGELGAWNPAGVSAESVAGLAYLVVFGSLVGFSAYIWLLGNTTTARVSTYAYVNPVVAVLLGWWLANEPLTARVLLAAGVIVAAVAVITTGRRPAAETAENDVTGDGRPASERKSAAA